MALGEGILTQQQHPGEDRGAGLWTRLNVVLLGHEERGRIMAVHSRIRALMEYQITGANRQTGEEVELFVEASSFREAERKANSAGVVVADVRECHNHSSVTTEIATEQPQPAQMPKGMRQCKVCGKGVAIGATTCPHCGDIGTLENLSRLFGALAWVVIGIFCVSFFWTCEEVLR